jgi:dihydroflavonol-4-reductase
MKVLIIGGTGFIGSYIARALINLDHQVTIYAREANDHIKQWLQPSEIIYGDLFNISDKEYLKILEGHDEVVFTAGVDDRTLPKRPSYPVFYRGNVETSTRLVTLALSLNITRFMFIGSYFTYFDGFFPDLQLAQTHPYIRSRIEQKKQVFDLLESNHKCVFIELPFVFGKVIGADSLWKPLIAYLKSRWPIFAPKGGTAVVSIDEVTRVAVEALRLDSGLVSLQPAMKNMTWRQLFAEISKATGIERRIYPLPKSVFDLGLKLLSIYHFSIWKEGGLNFSKLSSLVTRELFLPCKQDSMDEAFRQTID